MQASACLDTLQLYCVGVFSTRLSFTTWNSLVSPPPYLKSFFFFLTLFFSLSLITDQIYLSFPYLNSSSPHFILPHYYYTSSESLSSSHLYSDNYFYSPVHIDQISHYLSFPTLISMLISPPALFTPFRSIPPSYFFSILLIRLIPLLLFPPTLTFLCCQDNSLSQLF